MPDTRGTDHQAWEEEALAMGSHVLGRDKNLVEKVAPGQVVLFGSGETAAAGGGIFEILACALPVPLHIAILETPAGFELNSEQVARRVADFLSRRLQNYQPQIDLVPARKKGTLLSPDNPDLIGPMRQADVIFLGAGSPTYATRQLRDSLAWHTLLARHRLGGVIVLASAATLAASAKTLPVYDIYKVGAELHSQAGLDLFGAFGLELIFVPHWNNSEGGVELDTSRCFMGQERFHRLSALLSSTVTVVGIDEHTALLFDFTRSTCSVAGVGGVTILRREQKERFRGGDQFLFQDLGAFRMPELQMGIPAAIWAQVQQASAQDSAGLQPPTAVLTLVDQRQAAREARHWARADQLRDQIETLGWKIADTPAGPVVAPRDPKG